MSAPSARLLRNPLVWLRRFRHRRGYGVHSPFAFAFITGVVLERLPYYAYAELAALHPWWMLWLGLRPVERCRLLFRLANFAEAARVVLVAVPPLYNKYVRASRRTARVVECARCGAAPEADLVVVGAGRATEAAVLPARMPAGGMLVVEGIHDSAAHLSAWRAIVADAHTGVTFDLYDFGIAFFDHRLTKQHYVVNF